jgi:hypothetical protein
MVVLKKGVYKTLTSCERTLICRLPGGLAAM